METVNGQLYMRIMMKVRSTERKLKGYCDVSLPNCEQYLAEQIHKEDLEVTFLLKWKPDRIIHQQKSHIRHRLVHMALLPLIYSDRMRSSFCLMQTAGIASKEMLLKTRLSACGWQEHYLPPYLALSNCDCSHQQEEILECFPHHLQISSYLQRVKKK